MEKTAFGRRLRARARGNRQKKRKLRKEKFVKRLSFRKKNVILKENKMGGCIPVGNDPLKKAGKRLCKERNLKRF
jgi:hypothetical protein